MWKTLHHPDVLPLLGVTVSDGHFAMVSEWMTNGNINEFVTVHRNVNRFEPVRFRSCCRLRLSPMKLLLTAQRLCPGVGIHPWRGDDTRGSERGMVSNASCQSTS